MFKFIQNLGIKDDGSKVKIQWISVIKFVDLFWIFCVVFRATNRKKAKRNSLSYKSTLIYQKYIHHWIVMQSNLLQFQPTSFFSLHFFSFRTLNRSDDSRSANWRNVRQDPQWVAWAWCGCRRERRRSNPRMVGEATTSAERHGWVEKSFN